MTARNFIFTYELENIEFIEGRVSGFFHVLYQDPIFSKKFEDRVIFTASNGWRIKSSHYPEISPSLRIIYIRGRRVEKTISSQFSLSFEAYDSVVVALQQFCTDFSFYPKRKNGHLLTKIFCDAF